MPNLVNLCVSLGFCSNRSERLLTQQKWLRQLHQHSLPQPGWQLLNCSEHLSSPLSRELVWSQSSLLLIFCHTGGTAFFPLLSLASLGIWRTISGTFWSCFGLFTFLPKDLPAWWNVSDLETVTPWHLKHFWTQTFLSRFIQSVFVVNRTQKGNIGKYWKVCMKGFFFF